MDKFVFYIHLYNWYEQNKRILPWRETDNAYYIWLSEIILQQTRVAQGMDYYLRLINRFPTIADLANASEQDVLREWQGLGYYSRARNLHKAAKIIGNQPFPDTFDAIRNLPGIGDYTAGAIMSFAFNQPYPAIDGNVYRVLARLGDIDTPIDTSEGKRVLLAMLNDLMDINNPKLFNSAIMEFGALFCTEQNSDCSHCPISAFCRAYDHATVALLPVRKPKAKPKDRFFLYSIYTTPNGRTLLHQRNQKDIWQHLWEFPMSEVDTDWSIDTNHSEDIRNSFVLKHTLSHQRIHARYIIKKVSELPQIPDTIAIAWSDLDKYPLSRLTLKALEKIAGL